MHWAASDVDMSGLPPEPNQPSGVRSAFDDTIELDPLKHGNSVSYAVSPSEHRQATAPSGSNADPRPATAELGKRLIEAIAANLAAFIDEVRRQPLGDVTARIPL